MTYGDTKTIIIGSYLNDGSELGKEGNFFPTEHFDECLLPVMNIFKDTDDSSVYFRDPETGRKLFLDNETKMSKGSTVRGRRNALRNTFSNSSPYVNAELGGLVVRPITIGLNLTNKAIRTIDNGGYVQVLEPVCHNYLAKYTDCFLVLETIHINVSTIHDVIMYPDRLKELIGTSKSLYHTNKVYKEAIRVFELAGVTDIKNRTPFEIRNELGVNSIRVVIMSIVRPEDMNRVIVDDQVIRIPEVGITILDALSKKTGVALETVARMTNDVHLNPEIDDTGSFRVYIVDNMNILSSKFTKMGHITMKIPVIKDKNRDDGLYVITHGISETHGDTFLPLNEIGDVDYIYDSVEECESGFNAYEQGKIVNEEKAHNRTIELEDRKIRQLEFKESQTEKDYLLKSVDERLNMLSKTFEDNLESLRKERDYHRKDKELERDYHHKSRNYDAEYEFNQIKSQIEKDKLKMEERLSQYKFAIGTATAVGAALVLLSKYS